MTKQTKKAQAHPRTTLTKKNPTTKPTHTTKINTKKSPNHTTKPAPKKSPPQSICYFPLYLQQLGLVSPCKNRTDLRISLSKHLICTS